MAASSCSECGGMRWVHYFSETKDGNLEEAFRLCPCNYGHETLQGERAREGVQNCTIRIVCSFELKVLKGLPGAKR